MVFHIFLDFFLYSFPAVCYLFFYFSTRNLPKSPLNSPEHLPKIPLQNSLEKSLNRLLIDPGVQKIQEDTNGYHNDYQIHKAIWGPLKGCVRLYRALSNGI